jgi:hypothetical protein
MTKTSNIVEFRTTRGRIETPLSISDFRKQVQYFLSAILEAQGSLQEICSLFKQDENIWPDQREYAIDLLQSMKEPIQEFCYLLNSSTRLPDGVVPLRYPLVITMHSMHELVNSLIHNITQIRSVSHTSSKRTVTQRRTIGECLEELISKTNEAKHRARVLFHEIDQAYFPKPGLVYK